MKRKASLIAPLTTKAGPTDPRLDSELTVDALNHVGHDASHPMLSGPSGERALDAQALRVEEQSNAAIGCKTSDVALMLLAQVIELGHELTATTSEDQVDALLQKATALLAELQPKTATEALLAAQMVGSQQVAMLYLAQATRDGQSSAAAAAHVLCATRLMRIFNEQVDVMLRLKGVGGQQRVVVEHVTVAAGGQAIVGTVTPRGRGTDGAESG